MMVYMKFLVYCSFSYLIISLYKMEPKILYYGYVRDITPNTIINGIIELIKKYGDFIHITGNFSEWQRKFLSGGRTLQNMEPYQDITTFNAGLSEHPKLTFSLSLFSVIHGSDSGKVEEEDCRFNIELAFNHHQFDPDDYTVKMNMNGQIILKNSDDKEIYNKTIKIVDKELRDSIFTQKWKLFLDKNFKSCMDKRYQIHIYIYDNKLKFEQKYEQSK